MKYSNRKEKWIGDKNFYRKVMIILIPMIIQQGVTNLVNLLDNVMVGQLGTESISGVAVANQLIFIFNLMIFGLLAGASIFGAQFFGKGDYKGFQETVHFRLISGLLLAAGAWIVFRIYGIRLCELYLGGSEETGTLNVAGQYLDIICWQFVPFVLVQATGSAVKDGGETATPMQASVLAIFANLILNYLLIYGKLGMPQMGVRGAALATVIARYLELLFLLASVVRKKEEFVYLKGLMRNIRISRGVLVNILITGAPLFLNETLWSMGTTMVNSCYAARGMQAVAATNINATVWNLFGIVLMAMGNAIGIMAGQKLGANDNDGAKDLVRKLMFLTVIVNIGIGLIIIAISGLIPQIYNTEPEVRSIATHLLQIAGAMLPITAYVNATYFTLRSGGKTVITFFFDCGFTWVICLPVAWILCHYTSLSVIWIYFAVTATDIVKAIIGTILIKSGIWINNVLVSIQNE